jgi:spore coat polysaccharide biosynthesis predicted glycosyltransferase SpsG
MSDKLKRNIVFLCKASKNDGMGHLFRSLALARDLHASRLFSISFHLIGPKKLNNHFVHDFHSTTWQQEKDLELNENNPTIICLDMIHISPKLFEKLLNTNAKLISLSPIFNRLDDVDIVIHRTKYLPPLKNEKIKIYAGIEYNIVRQECKKIIPSDYKKNLSSDIFSLAISMGGIDAPNKTLRVLKQIKNLRHPLLIWILLGEGYAHSYEDLVNEMYNYQHEIILIRSNRSIWNIMKNCSLAILAGGVTSYEAAYCGLPAINYLENKNRQFLIRELEEKNLALPSCYDISQLGNHIKMTIENPSFLQKINENGQRLEKSKILEIFKRMA